MKRKWEVIIGLIGMILCLIFLGGFSLTITSMDEKTFAASVFPILQESMPIEQVSESFEAVKTLAIWFGVTLLIIILLVTVATSFIWKNRHPKLAALFYTLAGTAALFGTQFIIFPLAFLFYIAAALCLLRKKTDREGADNVQNKSCEPHFERV